MVVSGMVGNVDMRFNSFFQWSRLKQGPTIVSDGNIFAEFVHERELGGGVSEDGRGWSFRGS